MKRRSSGFLDPRKCGDEVFDYVAELHEYLWRFVRAANPGASGMLTDLVDAAVLATEGKVNPGILPGVPYMDRALKAEESVDRLTAEVARMQGERDAATETLSKYAADLRNESAANTNAQTGRAMGHRRIAELEAARDHLQSALDAEKRAHASTRADLISSEAQRKGAIEHETKKLRDALTALRALHGTARELLRCLIDFGEVNCHGESCEAHDEDDCTTDCPDPFTVDHSLDNCSCTYGDVLRAKQSLAPDPAKREEAPAIPSSVYTPVLAFFDSDHDKANEWFRTFNPLLGMTPMDLIALGKVDRLKAFIETWLAENAPAMQGAESDTAQYSMELIDQLRAALARCTQERDTEAQRANEQYNRAEDTKRALKGMTEECAKATQAAADRGAERNYYKNDRDSHEAQWRVAYQSVLDDRAALESNAAALTQRLLAADTKARGLELELAAERARGKTLLRELKSMLGVKASLGAHDLHAFKARLDNELERK